MGSDTTEVKHMSPTIRLHTNDMTLMQVSFQCKHGIKTREQYQDARAANNFGVLLTFMKLSQLYALPIPNCHRPLHVSPREGSSSSSSERHTRSPKTVHLSNPRNGRPETSNPSTSLGLLLGPLNHGLGVARTARVICIIHFGITVFATA